jgi:hypothetical protein
MVLNTLMILSAFTLMTVLHCNITPQKAWPIMVGKHKYGS